MKVSIRTAITLCICFSGFNVNAYEVGVEFSAEAIQSMPDRPAMVAKMYVSKNAVRTESAMLNGQTMTEIVYIKDNRRVMLNSIRKTYIDQTMPGKSAVKKNKQTPCHNLSNSSCKKIGQEKINDRNAVKWEMTIKRNGRTYKSLHWLDKEHYFPVREQFHDGTVSNMTSLGKEQINGRETEKWKFHAVRPDGKNIESLQWYDKKLKMVIREVIPGGYVRELRNIKVEKQDKKLFVIPEEYKKESMPAMAPPVINQGVQK